MFCATISPSACIIELYHEDVCEGLLMRKMSTALPALAMAVLPPEARIVPHLVNDDKDFKRS